MIWQDLLNWVNDPTRTPANLQAACRGLGLPHTGNRTQMRARLRAHIQGQANQQAQAAWQPPGAPRPRRPRQPLQTQQPVPRPNRWPIATAVLAVVLLLSLVFASIGWSGGAEPTETKVTAEVTREVVVEKEVRVTVEVVKEKVVERPIVETVVVEKVVTATPKPTTPTPTAATTAICQVPDVIGLSVLGAINAMDAWFEETAWQWGSAFDHGNTVPTGAVFWTDLGAGFQVPSHVSRIVTQGNWGVFKTTQSFTAPSAGRYVTCP